MEAGIETIEVLVPKLYIELAELEKERNIDCGRITSQETGVGNRRSAVMDAHQNVVTLGATLVHKTMEKYNIGPDQVAGLMVGTESSLDEAVAINCRIVGALEQLYGEGSLRHWGFPESKGACAATGYNNYFATLLFWSGELDEDMKIFSLAVDNAKYGLRSRGEATRGCGATLEIIGTTPIWTMERGLTTRSILDEYGFSRPFGELYPKIRSKESIISYNYLQRDGVNEWMGLAVKKGLIDITEGKTIFDYVQRIIPHMPYWRMAKDYAAFLFRHVYRKVPEVWGPIIDRIGVDEPAHDGKGSIETIMKDDQLWKKDKDFRAKVVDTQEFNDFFDRIFSLALYITPEIGNIYNGSIGLGKRSIIEMAYRMGIDITGERHAFGHFGSGAIGTAQTTIVQNGWKDVAKNYDLLKELQPIEQGGTRTPIDISTYETLHKLGVGYHDKNLSILEPDNEFIISAQDADGHLKYMFVG